MNCVLATIPLPLCIAVLEQRRRSLFWENLTKNPKKVLLHTTTTTQISCCNANQENVFRYIKVYRRALLFRMKKENCKKRPLLLSLYVLMAICRPKRCTTLKKRSHNSFSLSRESSHKYTLNSHRVTFSVSIQITNDKGDLKCCRHVVVIFKRRKRNKSIYEIQVVEDNTRRIGNTKCQM